MLQAVGSEKNILEKHGCWLPHLPSLSTLPTRALAKGGSWPEHSCSHLCAKLGREARQPKGHHIWCSTHHGSFPKDPQGQMSILGPSSKQQMRVLGDDQALCLPYLTHWLSIILS